MDCVEETTMRHGSKAKQSITAKENRARKDKRAVKLMRDKKKKSARGNGD